MGWNLCSHNQVQLISLWTSQKCWTFTNLIKEFGWSLGWFYIKNFDCHFLAIFKLAIIYRSKPSFSNHCFEVVTCNSNLSKWIKLCTYMINLVKQMLVIKLGCMHAIEHWYTYVIYLPWPYIKLIQLEKCCDLTYTKE